MSLPAFTLVIAACDSINPCAFFVLLFLLSLLIHAQSRVRMAVVSSGKEARTDVECLISAEVDPNRSPISGVRCTLHTGRTHQIRVHLSHRKHPLVADTLYGGEPALGMERQALHAERLTLEHPEQAGLLMSWTAPLPKDAAQLEATLRGLSKQRARS